MPTYLVTRARYAHKVPDGISLAQAALAEPLAVVIKGLRRLGALAPVELHRSAAPSWEPVPSATSPPECSRSGVTR